MSAIDTKAVVDRFKQPADVLKKASDTLIKRGKAYGDFNDFVQAHGHIQQILGTSKLNEKQNFLMCMIILKLQRWCNAPSNEQNADSLMDAINYLAALHVASYPVTAKPVKEATVSTKPEVWIKRLAKPYKGYSYAIIQTLSGDVEFPRHYCKTATEATLARNAIEKRINLAREAENQKTVEYPQRPLSEDTNYTEHCKTDEKPTKAEKLRRKLDWLRG